MAGINVKNTKNGTSQHSDGNVSGRTAYYPTIIEAAHLVVLYIFIQAIVDFPLALWDYLHGTEYLSNTYKNLVIGIGSFAFIIYYGYKKSGAGLKQLFPVRRSNILVLAPMLLFLGASHVLLDEVNRLVDTVIPAPAWFWELFERIFENDYGIYGTILKVAVIAPIVEELIFRGIIMHGLMRNNNMYTAILISALFFALFHLNPWQFPATFSLGLLLGWIMVTTRNIFLCIAGHAINNMLVLLTVEYRNHLQEFSFFLLEKREQLIISSLIVALALALIVLISAPKGWRKRLSDT